MKYIKLFENWTTSSKEESEQILNDYLEEFGVERLSSLELMDFDLEGGESADTLRGYASDYANEIATERAESISYKRSGEWNNDRYEEDEWNNSQW